MAKKEISFKQVGQNVIIVVDGAQYSKKMVEKTNRESLKEKVEAFNKKNTATLQKEIVAMFNEKKEAVKEKVAKVEKTVDRVKTASKIISNKAKETTTATKTTSKKTSAKKTPSATELLITDLEKAQHISDEEIARLSAVIAAHKKPQAPVTNTPTKRRGEH